VAAAGDAVSVVLQDAAAAFEAAVAAAGRQARPRDEAPASGEVWDEVTGEPAGGAGWDEVTGEPASGGVWDEATSESARPVPRIVPDPPAEPDPPADPGSGPPASSGPGEQNPG
jgi:hypothetical protein